MEEWRDISGYEGLYQVSNLSRVKSLDRTLDISNPPRKRFFKGKILSPIKSKIGYLVVSLTDDDKKRKIHYIHRLTAIAFIPNSNGVDTINHIDSDKTNNSLDNLEWCTQRENMSHFFKGREKTSAYIGVSYNKIEKRWYAVIRIKNKPIWLGAYKKEKDAISAHRKYMTENNIQNKYATL